MNDFTITLSIVGLVCIGISTAYALWRRHIDKRSVSGTGTDTRPVGDSIERAGRDAERAADNNRRATDDNHRAQELVQKAKGILNSAQHIDSNN